MKSKLIILGCGSSIWVPRIDGFWGNCNKNENKNIRTRCSAVIIKGSNIILIDASPDMKHQLISHKIKDISSVFITHEHADQTNGLFELRPFYWKHNYKKIDAYADFETMRLVRKRQECLFKKASSYLPIIKSNIIKSKFSLGRNNEKITFDTIKASHGKINSLIYIFEKTAYVSDCNDLSIVKLEKLKNLRHLILDCLRINKHPSHFNLEEAIYVHNCLRPKKTILTNLHHSLDYNHLLKKLPRSIIPAYDGLKINL